MQFVMSMSHCECGTTQFETTTEQVYVTINSDGTYYIKAFDFFVQVGKNKFDFFDVIEALKEKLDIELLFDEEELPECIKPKHPTCKDCNVGNCNNREEWHWCPEFTE